MKFNINFRIQTYNPPILIKHFIMTSTSFKSYIWRLIDSSIENSPLAHVNIPIDLLKNSEIKPSDVVSIDCGNCSYICTVLLTPSQAELTIDCDKTVKCDNVETTKPLLNKIPQFSCDFKIVKPVTFKRVLVKLVIKNEACDRYLNKQSLEGLVKAILQNYVVKQNTTFKCPASFVMYPFQSIIIYSTFHDENSYGQLNNSSTVELIDIISHEQISMWSQLKNLQPFENSELRKRLNLFLFEKAYKSVIVTGPLGCGKSIFVQTFCKELNVYCVVIDGRRNIELTGDQCESLVKHIIQYLNVFPKHSCVLLIDHIDKVAPHHLLCRLVESLENANVFIIGTAQQRGDLHWTISRLFQEELFIGMPSFSERKDMLQALTKRFSNCQIDYDSVAGMMPGFVIGDIVHMIREIVKQKNMEAYTEDASLCTRDFETYLQSASPSILKTSQWNLKVKPVKWKDIGGMEDIKRRLQMSIERPLRHPEIYKKVDLNCPRGVLLFGPPGCCKTTLARGLATECNANFFAANPSQIYSPYVGESEKNISQLFYQARLCAPSIIFLDELDSLVGRRNFSSKEHGIAENVLSTLLNEMDGLGVKTDIQMTNENDKVIVVAATNRPDCIDDALLRPGRIDIILYIAPPNTEERLSILRTLTGEVPLHGVDLNKIADMTDFYTGADLKNVCKEAAMNAIRKDIANVENKDERMLNITEEDFLQALEKVKSSVTQEQLDMYERLSARYGPVISK